ncbi:MAG: hypothetical protein ACPLXO_01565 [Desulfurella sp.]|uniref:hypothetical protein n=1 Tax=Desulfurella sp. TaxID=1962857 RepID=UPI003C82A3A3
MLKKFLLAGTLLLALSVNAFAQAPYRPSKIHHPYHHKVYHHTDYKHKVYKHVNHRLIHRNANYHAATPALPTTHTPAGTIPAQRAIPNPAAHKGY